MSKEMRRLLEAVEELNEAWVEYRDPGGHFQIVYQPPRGYFAIARNDLPDISGESFDDVEDAIEHAQLSLGVEYMDEDFVTDVPRPRPLVSPETDDAFNDRNPAQDMHVKAMGDIPGLYMQAGDVMYLKPTDNHGEVYSEENGMTYDWDFIHHQMQMGNLEQIEEPGVPGELVPYEEGLEEGDDIIETDGRRLEYPTTVEKVPDELDQVLWTLQRKITDAAYTAQQTQSYLKRSKPEDRATYNQIADIEQELDELRRRIFELR